MEDFTVRTAHVSQRKEDVTDTRTAVITLMKSVVKISTLVIELSEKYLIQIRALLSANHCRNSSRQQLVLQQESSISL